MADVVTSDFTPEEVKLLETLEQKHKRIFPFKIQGHGLVVMRKPLRSEWKKYLQDNEKPMVDKIALKEILVKNLFAHPGPDAFDAVMDDYPGLLEPFVMCAESLAAGTTNEVVALGKDWKKPDATI